MGSVKQNLKSIFSFTRYFKYKSISIVFIVVIILPSLLLAAHEVAVKHFPETTCTVCHEMEEPVRKWKESGTAKNHHDCTSCHFDDSWQGYFNMHKESIVFLIKHFQRDPEKPIEPSEEPIILDREKAKEDPAYWSMVPNYRCYSCKDVTNDNNTYTHTKQAQNKIHGEDIENVLDKPCLDCHNHEMRKGQKFCEECYE